MEKLDFKADPLYKPGREFEVVEVPTFEFLMVDGHGDPNTAREYAEAVEALYALSYAAKFASKREGRDYVVGPLEGLWWGEGEFAALSKSEWSWTMMIRQPDWLTDEIRDASRSAAAKKNLPALEHVRHAPLAEGTALQVMHLGPYDDEAPTIARMHEWIAANGYRETTAHHEIYLGDPRRTEPAKLKTILRQPMALLGP